MSQFRHHPDGIIYIDDFSEPLSEFLIDEPGYTGLKFGRIGRIYQQGSYHISTDGGNQYPELFPWPEGDTYVSKKAIYQAAFAARHPAPSPPSPPPPSSLGPILGSRGASVTISDTAQTATISFPIVLTDTNYKVLATASGFTGTPPVGASVVRIGGKTINGFTVGLVAAPGTGNSVTIDLLVVRV